MLSEIGYRRHGPTPIKAIHTASRGVYGTPRLPATLRAQGVRIRRRRVARLMLQQGLRGICRRRRKGTPKRTRTRDVAPDHGSQYVSLKFRPACAEANREVFSSLEGFYNRRRIHSALDYRSPVAYERRYALEHGSTANPKMNCPSN